MNSASGSSNASASKDGRSSHASLSSTATSKTSWSSDSGSKREQPAPDPFEHPGHLCPPPGVKSSSQRNRRFFFGCLPSPVPGSPTTNQYAPISMTRNRNSATTNSRYSTLTLPPPNKVNSVPAKPTTIPIEPVMSIVFSKVSPDDSSAFIGSGLHDPLR